MEDYDMSDLSATNCGCGCDDVMRRDRDCGCGFAGNNCLWIILLLIFCGGCGNGWGRGGDDCRNDSCLWIILLLIFCGGFGNGCDCC